MKILKKVLINWPIILTLLVVVWCILCIVGGSLENDDFFVGVFFFYLLLPLCAFVSSIWYGTKIKSKKKWWIVLTFGIIQLVLVSFPFGYAGFGFVLSDIFMGLQTAVPSAVGLLIGEYIVKYKKKHKKKQHIIKKIIFILINMIILFIIYWGLLFAVLTITSFIYSGYEKIEDRIIIDRPNYKHELPPLWEAIEKFEVPKGYFTENLGSEESFENILRDNNKDDQVLMTVSLEDYKGLNEVKLRDIIRYSILSTDSKRKAKKWLDESEVSMNNGIKMYRKDKNVILYKDGTYIYVTLEPGTLKPTKEDYEMFNNIVNSIVIK